MTINKSFLVGICLVFAISSHLFAGVASQSKGIPAALMTPLKTALKSDDLRYEQIDDPFTYYKLSADKVFYLVFSQYAGTSCEGYGGPVHLALRGRRCSRQPAR